MKVLYITQYFSSKPMHASTVTTYEIVKRLSERGHDVGVISASRPTLLTVYSENPKKPSEMELIPVPKFDARWYDGFATLFSHTFLHLPLIANALLLNQLYEKFDVIISMYHPTHLATVSAYLLSRILKLPLVVKIHDFYYLPFPGEAWEPSLARRIYNVSLGELNMYVLKRSNIILAQGMELIEFAMREGVDEEKMILFPNGVDTSVVVPGKESRQLRYKLGLDGKSVILFLGGLYWDRHPELLVEALPKIVHETENVMVLFVGEGPEKSKLFNLSRRLSVSNFVKFIGGVEHSVARKFISLADVAVGPLTISPYPSFYSGIPLSVLEYMAAEKPVITCRGGVSKSLVIDGYNGIVLNPGDVSGLSSSLIKLIKDPGLSKSIGRNARKHVEKLYSWDILIARLDKVLNSLVPAD